MLRREEAAAHHTEDRKMIKISIDRNLLLPLRFVRQRARPLSLPPFLLDL